VNPEDLAASRWKPIRQAREHTAKAEQAHARSRARIEELQGQVSAAEHRDRQALGAALVDGKAAPASEAEKLKAELVQEEQNVEALTQAVGDAYGQIGRLVGDNREAWLGQTLREKGQGEKPLRESDRRARGCARGTQERGDVAQLAFDRRHWRSLVTAGLHPHARGAAP
jgi:hypothetical protein